MTYADVILIFMMKYNKQIRWLTFLLGPFIVLLCLYAIMPIQIATNFYSLLAENYNLQAKDNSKNLDRSLHLNNLGIVSTYFTELSEQLEVIIKLQKGVLFPFEINNYKQLSSQQQLNNKNLNFQIKNDQINQQSSLSILQTQKISAHTNNQDNPIFRYFSFLKTIFLSNDNKIQSVQFYAQKVNQSFHLQYFSTGNYSLNDERTWDTNTKYIETIDNFIREGNKSIILPLFKINMNKQLSFSLCKAFTDYETTFVVCQNINLNFLGFFLSQRLLKNSNDKVYQKHYILINPQTQVIDLPLLLIKFQMQADMNSFVLGNGTQLIKIMSSTNQLYHFNTYQNNSRRSFFSFIDFLSKMQTHRYLVFLTERNFKTDTSTFGNLEDRLNTNIILTVIMVFIQIIVISYVIKKLLDSVDKGLFQLEHMTDLIMKGDINIEIPNFQGTKDIKNVYQQAKIVNKLHRYSTQSYFSGHFSEKVLKYVGALQFLKSLNYDTGNLIENLGEAYTYIEEWDQSLKYLKKSVKNIMQKIEKRFGPFQEIYKMKLNRQILPHSYRKKQQILIRRLFKLNFCYIRYLELAPTRLKQFEVENPKDDSFKKRLEQLGKEFAEQTKFIKKAFYPNFQKFSECILIMIYESKQKFNNMRLEESMTVMRKTEEIFRIYEQNYLNVNKALKQKGSKNKYFFTCNKMTFHSRTNPDLFKLMIMLYKSKIIDVMESSPQKYIIIFEMYRQAFRRSAITLNTAYMLALEIKKTLTHLKIDTEIYQSTQIFKQLVPFRTFYDRKLEKQYQSLAYRKACKECIGLEREYLFLFDCQKDLQKQKQDPLNQFYSQRMNYLFNKLLKGHDRVSIIKFNTNEGINISCSLNTKQNNQALLIQSFSDAIKQRSAQMNSNLNQLFQGISTAAWRIKNLQKEKIIIIAFKSLDHYKMKSQRDKLKEKYRNLKRKKTQYHQQEITHNSTKNDNLGQHLIELMRTEGLKNTKVILFCGKDDNEDFIAHFGLKDINRRIWSNSGGVNIANNVVYIIEDKHRSDIDRILMPKVTDVPDNNIFVL